MNSMDIVSADWSARHKELGSIIRKPDFFPKAVEMVLSLHEELHTSKVGNSENENNIDALFKDLKQNEYAVMSSPKAETIAWAVWHLARIEDITMNLLVNNGPQVFNAAWQDRMQISLIDTGNAMTDTEIIEFSKQINPPELLNYRDAVGIKSRDIVRHLTADDMKRKISPDGVKRILNEGGVTEQADSIWLLDFWGKKDAAGIILMPLTRHQTLHLNDCHKWKAFIRRM